MIRESIQKLVEHIDLSREEAEAVMTEIMTGEATPAQIGAFLTALRVKGETVDEITGFAKVMNDCCKKIEWSSDERLLDTCGTGGDRFKTFNVSTVAAFVVAGAGVKVAKHGNRSVTSKSGSADLLEYLGLKLAMDQGQAEKCLREEGIAFLFAPAFHPAMKYAADPRREIGIRSVFNILGPLSNPAGADCQIMGVYDERLESLLASVMRNLGRLEAMVAHGHGGMDEISVTGPSKIAWLKNGRISRRILTPRLFGLGRSDGEKLRGGSPEENAVVAYNVLRGKYGKNDPRTDIVLMNAAAGLVVAGVEEDFRSAVALARESIESGKAYEKLRKLVKLSGGDTSRLEELERRLG